MNGMTAGEWGMWIRKVSAHGTPVGIQLLVRALTGNQLSGTWLSALQGDAGDASPARVAWTIALGFAVGMFPILGITTIACAILAKLLGLRQGPIQLGNYAALPFQIFLIIPFLRLGERLTGAERFTFDLSAMVKAMPHVPEEMARAVVYAQWHMIVGWAVVAPFSALVVGVIATAMLRKQYRRAMRGTIVAN